MSFNPQQDAHIFKMAEQTVQFLHDNYDEWKSGEMTVRDAAFYAVADTFELTNDNADDLRPIIDYNIDMVVSLLSKEKI